MVAAVNCNCASHLRRNQLALSFFSVARRVIYVVIRGQRRRGFLSRAYRPPRISRRRRGREERRRKCTRALPHGVPVTAGALAKQVPCTVVVSCQRYRACVFLHLKNLKDGVNDTFADDDDTYRQLDRLFHPIERPSRLSGPPDPTVSLHHRTCALFVLRILF